MNVRFDVSKYMGLGAMKALFALQKEVDASGLEKSLIDLVKIRASQINGCAFCIDMHTKDARAAGESEQRIYALDAWRETPFFEARERAGLECRNWCTRLRIRSISSRDQDEPLSKTVPSFTVTPRW